MRYHQLKENSALEKTEEIIKKTFSPERKEVQSEVLALARMAEMGRGDKTELLMKLTALTKKEMDVKKADPDLKHSVDSNVKIMAVAVEKLMGTTMDESWDEVKETELPPHLAKFFDKDGNLNPDAQARLDKGRAKRKKSKDVTPAGYGPADDMEEDIKMNSRGKLERDTPYGELPSELEDDDDDDLEARFNKAMKEDDTADYEKVMARQVRKHLADIRFDVAEIEDKISQLAEKDNGDLTDQITTMMKYSDGLYAVLSRAMKIVPTYEGTDDGRKKGIHPKGHPMRKKQQAAIAISKNESIAERSEKQDAFSAKEIKMAIGIASDKRYAKGNMTGAVNAIEKISKGLSNHKQVAAVLKRQNEAIDLDAMLASCLAEASEKSYTVVHVKHGKEVIKATSSYGAAKKYADMKKLKSTAGVDAHLMEGRNDGPRSECCDAPLDNYQNGLGICSDCGEHAGAYNADELMDEAEPLQIGTTSEIEDKYYPITYTADISYDDRDRIEVDNIVIYDKNGEMLPPDHPVYQAEVGFIEDEVRSTGEEAGEVVGESITNEGKNKMGPQEITPGDRVEFEGEKFEVVDVSHDPDFPNIIADNLVTGLRNRLPLDKVTRIFGADATTDQDKQDMEDMFKRLDKVGSGSLKSVATENKAKPQSIKEAQDTLMGVKDPVIVITDANGKPVDKLQMSIAAKKYKFNMAAIRPQFKHQDKVKHGNFTLSAPINGQPMEDTFMGVNIRSKQDKIRDKETQIALAKRNAPKSGLKAKDIPQLEKELADLKNEGYARLPDMPDKYVARDGLEGPIMTRSGKVVYYDKDEGKYYDPDTDMYLTYDEWKAFDPDLPIKESKATAITEAQFDEAAGEKDACYHKVKSRYKVWPSAYASGALTKCRKVGAANWGNSKKK